MIVIGRNGMAKNTGKIKFEVLNVSYMGTYSCRCSQESPMEMQEKVVSAFFKRFPSFYKGDFINLDFHSIRV